MDTQKRREIKFDSIYAKALITRNITIPIHAVGKNIHNVLEKTMSSMLENRCIVEGYVKSGSIKIITYSSGIIKGINVSFEVVFECLVCCPIEGMLVQCVAKNITKAGIRAESIDEKPSPIVVFVTRDHHYMNQAFSNIQEGDKFVARVIGQRFELNDKYVSVIAELYVKKEPTTNKPRLVIS